MDTEYVGRVTKRLDQGLGVNTYGLDFDAGDSLGFYDDDDTLSVPDMLTNRRFLLYPISGDGPPTESNLCGYALVGRRVAVYWPGCGSWCAAGVLRYNTNGRHSLRYVEDGEHIDCVLMGAVARLVDTQLAIE